ncbi:MAG: hypothetical protein H6883_07105 [Rhodobiaceae bacterium]|nr:hypothetical protein [Rhodobiaceae bacterium]MCC0055888.1 hypothetical protein [Rhodobiaceae bacterium]
MSGSRAKPTAGFPSQGDAIRAMLMNGTSAADTARSLSCTLNNVFRSARRRGMAQAKIWINSETVDAINAAGRSRGVSPTFLMQHLLHVIARDDMFDAVLDDGEGGK